MDLRARYQGALLGLAAGDAVGTTVEFQPRGTFAPITDMVGGGPFGLLPGQWTDDTSMALCLAASLVEQGEFDARDQMDRYCAWMQHGYMSSTGTCFDIGITTSTALRAYLAHGNPTSGSTDPRAAGNGSIMRLAPVPMFFYPDMAAAIHHAAESSRTTHGAPQAVDSCRLLALFLCRAFAGAAKDDLLFAPITEVKEEGKEGGKGLVLDAQVAAIAAGDYRAKTIDRIHSDGYVLHTLEAALWCFWQTTSYADAVLMAVNLGHDADTTAAVCGQIAGAYYGVGDIPAHWLAQLALRTEIEELVDRLLPAPI